MKLTIAKPQAIHELGRRDNQEDSLFPRAGQATAEDRFFVLCDGMGGHEHGEVASQTVAETLGHYLAEHADPQSVVTDETLLRALEAAYTELDKKDDSAVRKMGTTLCLLALHRGGATILHIGDSRIYHIRPAEERLLYQSKDHSLVYELYEAGEISFDEMQHSPQKNVITRAMQPGEDNRMRPSVVHVADLRAGDYLYLCSDGMLEAMSNEELCRLFARNESDEQKRARLVAATQGNNDNHSAYFVRINTVQPEAGDEALPDDEQTSPDNALNLNPARTPEDDVEMVAPPESEAEADVTPVPRRAPQAPRTDGNAAAGRNRAIIAALVAFIVVLIGALFFMAWPKEKKEAPAPVQQRVIRHERKAPQNTHARKVKTTTGKKTKADEQKATQTDEKPTTPEGGSAPEPKTEKKQEQAETSSEESPSPQHEQSEKARPQPVSPQRNKDPLPLNYKSV